MNDREEVRAAFIELLKPFVHRANMPEVTEETCLIDDLDVNSARLVDIILETEDRFSISIDDESADSLRTVGDAIQLILAKRQLVEQG